MSNNLPPLPAVPFSKAYSLQGQSLVTARGPCHPHTHEIKTTFLELGCGGCGALSENRGKLYNQSACQRPRVGTSAFPGDRGGDIFSLTKTSAMFRGTRTGNLQSFLPRRGLCYHLLGFKTNVRRQKRSFLMLQGSPSRREQGGTYRKEQDPLSSVP